MIGIRKHSQPDLRKTSNNSHVGRSKTHEKGGGVSFLGINVGKTKNRSSSVPRGKVLAYKYLLLQQILFYVHKVNNDYFCNIF